MMGGVLIVVTHLLGSGHLVRARHLARALAEAGFAVTLASGGMPLNVRADEPFTFVQLPPAKVEGVDFRNLLDEAGQPIDAQRRETRRDLLSELAASLRPDIVITEHFPFGRRQLADEFLGVIAAARLANPKTLVLASIRDVLVAPRADRIVEAEARIAAHFDAVLVHGDAGLLPLEASWPVSKGLAGKLVYTGYLAASRSRSPHPEEPRSGVSKDGSEDAGTSLETRTVFAPQDEGCGVESAEILVSGGGSGAALPLFEMAIAAARLGDARRWRILVGKGLAEADFVRLQASAPANAIVERARPDFPTLLANCALSISQAGYNTVLDLVAAERPAIVVPFDEGAETEQGIRAEAMARAGLARCLRMTGPDALTPETLANAVETALRAGMPAPLSIDRDGASAVAGIVTGLIERKR
ncbi:Predicted glycosyl transferase [Bosea lathyri]|uniref:Predicted glycosyl transferase n=2 Tax=Bosea lathyri TaxID=1036778 RepID=A0A1H6ARI9_9HYPH|nr:Predicted glycosyl transferase [Bosea lathyri]